MIHLPHGFVFSACAAGLKASGKPDLAFALAPEGASAVAMFTRNQVAAAPVVVGREHLRAGKGRSNPFGSLIRSLKFEKIAG